MFWMQQRSLRSWLLISMKLMDCLLLLWEWQLKQQFPRYFTASDVLFDSIIIFLMKPLSFIASLIFESCQVNLWRHYSHQGHENATAENGPWVITLDAPCYLSVMQHAKNRALRKEVYYAYITRASSGEMDNTSIIDQILKLRLEKAKILNFNNYAEVCYICIY